MGQKNHIYYTADLHFFDKTTYKWDRINQEDSEYFLGVEEKNEVMISRWNSRVTNRDHVYILGDVFSCSQDKARVILKQLNGAKHFIIGNHDRPWLREICEYKKYGILECTDYKEIYDHNRMVVLSHYPIMFWNEQHAGSYHIYGHVHASREAALVDDFGKLLVDMQHLPEYRAYNAGAMVNRYMPVTLDELIERYGGNKLSKEEFSELDKQMSDVHLQQKLQNRNNNNLV
jgi:calcineurin-like phosphoesterase family protein